MNVASAVIYPGRNGSGIAQAQYSRALFAGAVAGFAGQFGAGDEAGVRPGAVTHTGSSRLA